MKKVLVLALLTVVLAACSNKPIYNVENHPIPITAQRLPPDRIEALIIQAGSMRNWRFQKAGPGHLVAVQTEPKHSATVDIYFDQNSYRIIKNQTVGLKEKDGTIHPTYNRWISYLEHDIDTVLTNAGVVGAS